MQKGDTVSIVDDFGFLSSAFGKVLPEFVNDLKGADDRSEILFSSLARLFASVIGYPPETSNFAVFLFERIAFGEKLGVSYFESTAVTLDKYEPVLSVTAELLTNGVANAPTRITQKQLLRLAPNAENLPRTVFVVPIRSDHADYGYVAVFCHGETGHFSKKSPQMEFVTLVMHIVVLFCRNRNNEAMFEHYLMNDHLTELPNRAHIYEAIIYHLQTAGVFGSRFAIFIIKVNGIKHINDSLGIITGDMALKEMGMMIKSAVPKPTFGGDGYLEALVGRLSGDDFVALVTLPPENVDEQEDAETAKSLCKSIIEKTKNYVEISGHKLYLSANIGASIYPYHGDTAEELLRKADLAKSASKANGPRSFAVYEHFMDGDAGKILFLSSNLPIAIANNQFELFYQAQIDAQTEKLAGAEALIRWRHPERGMIPPGEFVDFAESNALGIQIDKLVLEMACEQIIKWQDKDFNLVVSVNISPKHFENGLIYDTLSKTLESTKVKASQLKIELLESVLVDDFDGTVEVINALRTLGVKVALDDFGTGYSSLEYVAKLPLDYLKIDRTFSMNLEKAPGNEILLRTIMTLARGMKVKTIAEGVENRIQLDFLRSIGCDLAQGYYINKPMDSAAFEEKFLIKPTA